MSLKDDLRDAILSSIRAAGKEPGREAIKGATRTAAMQAKAIIDFLVKQELEVSELKAIVELETMETTGPLKADISSTVKVNPGQKTNAQVPPPGTGAGATATTDDPGTEIIVAEEGSMKGTKGGVIIPRIDYSKEGGQGGVLTTKGYAYIGPNPIDASETNEQLTKVIFNPDKIKDA